MKPCPFCGSKELKVNIDFMIQCCECKTIFIQPQTKKPKSMLKVWEMREVQDETN